MMIFNLYLLFYSLEESVFSWTLNFFTLWLYKGANMLKYIFILFSINVFSVSGLEVGAKAPEIKLETITGKNITLGKAQKVTVLVFYRGAWCPYCVKQLNEIEKDLMPKIKDVEVVAISVDRKKIASKMKAKFKYSFNIVSNSTANILKDFKIANKLDELLVKKYKNSYKIDIEGDSGETHHLVAHPAVFIISKDGTVSYADIHVDYKQRTKIKDILKALGSK